MLRGGHIIVILAAIVLLAQPAHADALGEELAGFSLGLKATATVGNTVMVKSPQAILVKISAENPSEDHMPIYLLRQRGEDWEMVRLIGSLTPGKQNQIELEVQSSYAGQPLKKTRYAIVGRAGDGQLYGAYFELTENWQQYEKGIDDTLSSAILTFVPVVGAILVLLLLVMARTAYSSKSKGAYSGEYTVKSLIFPAVGGRPFAEKIADMMMHPIALAFELLCVAVLSLGIFEAVMQQSGIAQAAKLVLLSGLGALSIPLVYFAASWFLVRREEGKPLRFFAGMFGWGMFSAFLALLVSSWAVSEFGNFGIAGYAIIATMLISPIVEEVLKGLGVLGMSGHHDYNDTLTGLLLGFTCGAGFAFVENWFYFAAKTNPFELGLSGWVTLIIYRSFFNTMAHGCFTAAVSTTIGYMKSAENLRRFSRLAFIPGIFLAIMLHVIFNLSALADSFVVASKEALFFVFNPTLIILLAALFFLVLVLAIIDEKKRKMKKAGIETFEEIAAKG